MPVSVDQAKSPPELPEGFSGWVAFDGADWQAVPDEPGVYAIGERDELLYIGMAGREGKGTLRRRLRDHASGQVVNMFAQYLFFAKAQFLAKERVTHPSQAKALCQRYIASRCWLAWRICSTGAEARALEAELKASLRPSLNGTGAA